MPQMSKIFCPRRTPLAFFKGTDDQWQASTICIWRIYPSARCYHTAQSLIVFLMSWSLCLAIIDQQLWVGGQQSWCSESIVLFWLEKCCMTGKKATATWPLHSGLIFSWGRLKAHSIFGFVCCLGGSTEECQVPTAESPGCRWLAVWQGGWHWMLVHWMVYIFIQINTPVLCTLSSMELQTHFSHLKPFTSTAFVQLLSHLILL